jgi:hypothetical protein
MAAPNSRQSLFSSSHRSRHASSSPRPPNGTAAGPSSVTRDRVLADHAAAQDHRLFRCPERLPTKSFYRRVPAPGKRRRSERRNSWASGQVPVARGAARCHRRCGSPGLFAEAPVLHLEILCRGRYAGITENVGHSDRLQPSRASPCALLLSSEYLTAQLFAPLDCTSKYNPRHPSSLISCRGGRRGRTPSRPRCSRRGAAGRSSGRWRGAISRRHGRGVRRRHGRSRDAGCADR